ncbi:unnamed protein product [Cyprideis torosa]|uniref:Uncharacterized protein n=1 Tax=Cyprideis torosa TaxID=163714 RepID=A0A7R8ZMQ7_9CRUS|nr:unnamed protein product [Cyprideis torosa]CAG0886129.1 unnamed protein product [Cyprideis torosa]
MTWSLRETTSWRMTLLPLLFKFKTGGSTQGAHPLSPSLSCNPSDPQPTLDSLGSSLWFLNDAPGRTAILRTRKQAYRSLVFRNSWSRSTKETWGSLQLAAASTAAATAGTELADSPSTSRRHDDDGDVADFLNQGDDDRTYDTKKQNKKETASDWMSQHSLNSTTAKTSPPSFSMAEEDNPPAKDDRLILTAFKPFKMARSAPDLSFTRIRCRAWGDYIDNDDAEGHQLIERVAPSGTMAPWLG